ncbi:unnamed protein product [Ambrosiozyma monospora]|uniref:Unnamed protein product n=1 Tax=Ambrosiozyma monospora TaxID=43982 RepID=A0ACB5UCJ6_AMBMO|nr:unnamed protein product [Ambrosiozyma monospora]
MAHSENSIPMEDLSANANATSNINDDENASALNPFSSTPQTQRNASPQFLNTPTEGGAAYLEVPTDAPSTSTNAQQQPTQQQQPLLQPSTANKTSPVREQFGLNDEDPNDNDNLPLGGGYTSLPPKRTDLEEERKGFPYWKVFCYAVTFWAPPPFLKLIGLDSKERRYAWREKMGLIAIIMVIMGIIAFLTFGFTRSACTGLTRRLQQADILSSNVVINGRTYDLSRSAHPAATNVDAGTNV